MREDIGDWFLMVRLHCYHWWRLAREVRGVIQDRMGKHYWLLEDEWTPNHVKISVLAWPGLAYTTRTNGWLSVGEHPQKTSWMIYDIRVVGRNTQKGIGTALVHAAIDVARRRGAHELRGTITKEDARDNPFLAGWYAKLGFTVQSTGKSDFVADFWMDLRTAAVKIS